VAGLAEGSRGAVAQLAPGSAGEGQAAEWQAAQELRAEEDWAAEGEGTALAAVQSRKMVG